ncbi:MAG TPA: hypothetical protein VF627_09755 [Abditibacterium sp.]
MAPVYSAGKPKAPQKPKSQGLTAADVKAHVTKQEKRIATGVGGQHKTATVIFESIRLGKTRKTNERDRLINGVDGPMIYPARVKYTSHRTWGNGETEDKKIHYDYEFYKNSYGEWDAVLMGPVRE